VVTLEDLQSLLLKMSDQLVQIQKNVDEQERFFTVEQVCEILGVDRTTLHNWNKNRTLKSGKIGGRVIYRKSDIDAAIKK
jgi:excisionase family DNA binding protein